MHKCSLWAIALAIAWANHCPALTVTTTSDSPVTIRFDADPDGEVIHENSIIDVLTPYKSGGLTVEFSGHFILLGVPQFEGFSEVAFVGIDGPHLEQTNAYNDSAVFYLEDCSRISFSGLIIGGSGTARSDGNPPQQNAIRLVHCDDIEIADCRFEAVDPSGTMKHAVNFIDNSRMVSISDCLAERTSGGTFMVGSGWWPHPTDPPAFVGHWSRFFDVVDNEISKTPTGVVIDDESSYAKVIRNEISNHFGHAIIVEDGAYEFTIDSNICGPGRGSAVTLGHGQTQVWPRDGSVANNTARGCNDPSLVVPPLYHSIFAARDTFRYGSATNVTDGNNTTFLWY